MLTAAIVSGQSLTFTYDPLNRLKSEDSSVFTDDVEYQYDAAGRRTRITWPGNTFYVDYVYDWTNAVTQIRENGATSGAGLLGVYTYNNLGQRILLTRGNGVVTTFAYDDLARLDAIRHDLASTASDQLYDFTRNLSDQSTDRQGHNASYDWSPLSAGTTNYTDNNLNQYTAVGGASFSYDQRGNLTSDGTNSYGYDIHNRLISGPSSAALAYDPIGRLHQTSASGATTTRFLYDGVALIGEFNTSGTLLKRYVHGPGIDEPIVWYEGSGTNDRRWLIPDELGSIVVVTNSSGAAANINTFDDYGIPGSSNAGRFQYTGQTWLPELSLYHYKARAYAPRIGRFLQADPILYAGGINLYVYVGNDPVNWVDPLGLSKPNDDPLIVIARCEENPGCMAERAARQFEEALRAWRDSALPGSPEPPGEATTKPAGDLTDSERNRLRQMDVDICNRLRNPAMRAICFANVEERDADRLRGRQPRNLMPSPWYRFLRTPGPVIILPPVPGITVPDERGCIGYGPCYQGA